MQSRVFGVRIPVAPQNKHKHKNKMKIIGNRVAVIPEVKENTTSSGIIMMSAREDSTIYGKIISVGDGKTLKEGTVIPSQFKIDDVILFKKERGFPFPDEGCIMVDEDDILAFL